MTAPVTERVKEHRKRVRSEASAYIAKHKIKNKLDMVRVITLAVQDALDNVITVKHLNSVVYAFIQIKDILQDVPEKAVKYKDTRTLIQRVHARYFQLISSLNFDNPMPKEVALEIIQEEYPEYEGSITDKYGHSVLVR